MFNNASSGESNILIVDADTLITLSARRERSGGFSGSVTIMGENDRKAREILKAVPAALQISSLRMTVVNGYELVTFAERNFEKLTVFAIADDGAADIMERWSSRSSVRCFASTCDPQEIGTEITAELCRSLVHPSPAPSPQPPAPSQQPVGRPQTAQSSAPLASRPLLPVPLPELFGALP